MRKKWSVGRIFDTGITYLILIVVAFILTYSPSMAVSLSAHNAKLPPASALAPTLKPSNVSVSPVAVSLFLYEKIVIRIKKRNCNPTTL